MQLLICNNKVSKQYIDLGFSEAKMGEDIVFNKSFLLDYIFEKEQLLKIIITSPDKPNLENTLECTVARIMGSKNLCYKQKILLINYEEEPQENVQEKDFELIIDAKNAKESKELIKLRVFFNLIEQKRNLLKNYEFSQIFFTLNNFIDGKNYRSIYKSEELADRKGILAFDEIQIHKDQLCINDSDKILIRFYDSNCIEFADIFTNLEEIKIKNSNNVNNIIANNFSDVEEKESKQIFAKISYSFKAQKYKTFIDYLSENLEINLVIGIDFTASNGI
jgi:hypothetical protein